MVDGIPVLRITDEHPFRDDDHPESHEEGDEDYQ
jgi:hypothetical protein